MRRGCSGCSPARPSPAPSRASTNPTPMPRSLAEEAEALGHDRHRDPARRHRARLARGRSAPTSSWPTLRTATIEFGSPDGPQPLVIRTTGTTGAPKAARHDWRVLAQTVAKVRPQPDQRWLLAYGPHQFAGIQVLLHVLASQATLVAPFPASAERRPRGPPLRRRHLRQRHADLLALPARRGPQPSSPTPPAWSRSPSAARPAPPTSSTSSAPPFPSPGCPRCTHRPSSAPSRRSTTACRASRSGLSGARRTRPPTYAPRTASSGCGPRPACSVTPTRPTATAASSTAWRPTGDLVEIVGTRVLFRGRQSEIINVGGVKVHPLPVEERILALSGVDAARVYGRPSKLTGCHRRRRHRAHRREWRRRTPTRSGEP